MKNLLKFLVFLLYMISIFFVENLVSLLLLFLFNISFIIVLKIQMRTLFKNIRLLLPFVLLTGLLNIVLGDLKIGLLMIIRLLIAYQITYIFSKSMTSVEVAKVIQSLAYPLKILKIDNEKIGIMISISFCVLPILKSEIESKRYALEAKGVEFKVRNYFMIMKPLFISILRRTNEMEKSLMAKGYQEGESCKKITDIA